MMSEGALLLLEAARLRLTDGATLGPLDARADGSRAALVGAWSAWFRLLEQRGELASGTASVDGVPLTKALATGKVGLAPLDPPLPRRWTALRWLEESARLFGRGTAFAKRAAARAVERFELAAWAKAELAALPLAERRALTIANATLSNPRTLVAETPLFRLDDFAQARVERALETAALGIRLIFSATSLAACGRERALVARAEDLLILEKGHVRRADPGLRVGLPKRLEVTVARNVDAFERALVERGTNVRRLERADVYFALVAPNPHDDFVRFLVELTSGEQEFSLFEAALASSAPIVELRPATAATRRAPGDPSRSPPG